MKNEEIRIRYRIKDKKFDWIICITLGIQNLEQGLNTHLFDAHEHHQYEAISRDMFTGYYQYGRAIFENDIIAADNKKDEYVVYLDDGKPMVKQKNRKMSLRNFLNKNQDSEVVRYVYDTPIMSWFAPCYQPKQKKRKQK
jgi:hypothetical protein